MAARSTVLRGLLGASYYFGGPQISDVIRRGQTKILIYHGISNLANFDGITNYYGYTIPENFERVDY